MQNSPDNNRNAAETCPRAEEAAARLRDEMSPAEQGDFDQHCQGCAACRELLADLGRVQNALRARPAASLDADFASRVLAKLHAEQKDAVRAEPFGDAGFEWRRILRIAAGIALCIGAFAFWQRHPTAVRTAPVEALTPAPAAAARAPETQAIGEALDWLAHNQEESGAWDVAKWQGNKEYEVGLSGIALLAFMKEGGAGDKSEYASVVRKAAAYLAKQQDAQGAIGPECSGRMYNHGIATVALLEAYGKTGNRSLREPIARAVGFILAQQLASGGWGYESRGGRPANTSISFWQLQALQLAGAAKIGDTEVSCRRALRWLGSVTDSSGLVGYQTQGDFPNGSETLTAMGAVCLGATQPRDAASRQVLLVQRALQSVATKLETQTDLYRCFFLARAATAVGGPQSERPLAQLSKSLVAMRSTAGDAAGSWEPVGTWSPVGGRIFSTAMATLSLQACRTPGDVL